MPRVCHKKAVFSSTYSGSGFLPRPSSSSPLLICSRRSSSSSTKDLGGASSPTFLPAISASFRRFRLSGKPQPLRPLSSSPAPSPSQVPGHRRPRHCHRRRFFGALPSASDADSDSDEEGGEEEEEADDGPGNVFSKWFMVLEEKEQQSASNEVLGERDGSFDDDAGDGNSDGDGGCVGSEGAPAPAPAPPPNALLLMRCRSAPARNSAELEKEKEREKEREERLVLMSYAPDFFKVSTEIAKETWVVGSVDPLARSRSWKR